MKKTFHAYYKLTDTQYSTLWKSCIFVFDANVLLHLFGLSPETRDELIGVLEGLSDRVWISHQAALEYHKQQPQVIEYQEQLYSKLENGFNDAANEIIEFLRSSSQLPDQAAACSKKIEDYRSKSIEALEKHKKSHLEPLLKGKIAERLATLFGGKVGAPYGETRLAEIYELGAARYTKRIPPGFKDAEKEPPACYGDLVLWFQTIDQAKSVKKPVVFVTNDAKEDWWWKTGSGKVLGPRPMLVEEMFREAKVAFHMYKLDRFTEYAKKYLNQDVEDRTIRELQRMVEEQGRAHELSRMTEVDRLKLRSFEMQRQIIHEESRRLVSKLNRLRSARKREAAVGTGGGVARAAGVKEEVRRIQDVLNKMEGRKRHAERVIRKFRNSLRHRQLGYEPELGGGEEMYTQGFQDMDLQPTDGIVPFMDDILLDE